MGAVAVVDVILALAIVRLSSSLGCVGGGGGRSSCRRRRSAIRRRLVCVCALVF